MFAYLFMRKFCIVVTHYHLQVKTKPYLIYYFLEKLFNFLIQIYARYLFNPFVMH